MNFEKVLNFLTDWALTTGLKILISIILLVVLFRIITKLTRMAEKKLLCSKKHMDKTLVSTATYLLRIILKLAVAVCIVGYLGVDTGGITALIASLGVGIGLAVNGALSNLAGGALILLTRPFKIDDFIEAQGHSGTVEDIHIVSTRLRTPDNKVVYIPNGVLSAGTIINYSEKKTRRVDLIFEIPFTTDIEFAKSLINKVISEHGKILTEPSSLVRADGKTESSVTLAVRVWVNNGDYWSVYYDLIEGVRATFDEAKIKIPHNQLDVHLK